MRNVKKNADDGRDRVTAKRDLTAGEIQQLLETRGVKEGLTSGIVDAIADAFYFGFSVGYRQAKSK